MAGLVVGWFLWEAAGAPPCPTELSLFYPWQSLVPDTDPSLSLSPPLSFCFIFCSIHPVIERLWWAPSQAEPTTEIKWKQVKLGLTTTSIPWIHLSNVWRDLQWNEKACNVKAPGYFPLQGYITFLFCVFSSVYVLFKSCLNHLSLHTYEVLNTSEIFPWYKEWPLFYVGVKPFA